ncbi:hypothetical protein P691DRAFT_184610 [Macrolepiota fuliginosa MF-IS2]|uniref:Uncharacterized protein n=1 Tax=Macrolepiota fuliginosa MF-IS2 TaxID=1400762 RepID=A0A9P6C2A4_9AGAR|nr:hypothetical protein P691DRAFT_184610 [Macrolepiota fuliginosa MF-IS2]
MLNGLRCCLSVPPSFTGGDNPSSVVFIIPVYFFVPLSKSLSSLFCITSRHSRASISPKHPSQFLSIFLSFDSLSLIIIIIIIISLAYVVALNSQIHRVVSLVMLPVSRIMSVWLCCIIHSVSVLPSHVAIPSYVPCFECFVHLHLLAYMTL